MSARLRRMRRPRSQPSPLWPAYDVLEADPRGTNALGPGAVLLSDQIEALSNPRVTDLPLIFPFSKDQLRPAGYNLTLGCEAHVGGVYYGIDDSHPLLLQKHQIAIVSTYEELRIPRFLIARWNLKVSMAYEGLLWVGGAQVDPGWNGRLFAPIYNLSDRDVEIKYRKELFTMDFVTTTPYKPRISLPYRPTRRRLDEFDRLRLRSARREELDQLQDMHTQIIQFQNRLEQSASSNHTALASVVAVLSVIIAALTFIVTSPLFNNGVLAASVPLIIVILIAISITLAFLAVVVSMLAFYFSRRPRPSNPAVSRLSSYHDNIRHIPF